jgi:hypothetical protein
MAARGGFAFVGDWTRCCDTGLRSSAENGTPVTRATRSNSARTRTRGAAASSTNIPAGHDGVLVEEAVASSRM